LFKFYIFPNPIPEITLEVICDDIRQNILHLTFEDFRLGLRVLLRLVNLGMFQPTKQEGQKPVKIAGLKAVNLEDCHDPQSHPPH
jgi:hypothetical protein